MYTLIHHLSIEHAEAQPFESKNDGGISCKSGKECETAKAANCTKVSKVNDRSGDSERQPRDYAPLVLAEVKTGDGVWVKAKCLLDTGSNSSLVRAHFAKIHKLHGGNSNYVSFKVAGGGVHKERAKE